MNQTHPFDRCAGCGLEIARGTAGCQSAFETLVARDFGDVRFGRMHRLMVDVYCLQHPDRYCASAKSFAAHLTGLGWFMENAEASRARGSEVLRRWLNGNPKIARPTELASRGALTIGDVRGATDPAGYKRAVEEWARSTWAAYAPLHEQAYQWIEQAYRRREVPKRSSRASRGR